jgi:hypothetical protein
MKCAGCSREIEVGDSYLEATASEILGSTDTAVDDLIAEVTGGRDGKVVYCEDCTEPGGRFRMNTYYGDEDEDVA